MQIGRIKLLRLARRNELSLELRHQWRKRTGHDPVNVERGALYVEWAVILLIPAILAFIAAMMTPAEHKSLETVEWLVSSVCSGFMTLSIILSGKQPALAGCGFGRAYGDFHEWIRAEPSETAELDLPDLRSTAQNVMVHLAQNILLMQKKAHSEPGWDEVPENLLELSNLMSDLKRKYNTFELLNLVNGGYRYFYSVAEKELREKKEKATDDMPVPPESAPVGKYL